MNNGMCEVLKELRRLVNYENAVFSDFDCGDFHYHFPFQTPVGTEVLTEAIKEATKRHRDAWINPIIDGLVKYLEGEISLLQLKRDLGMR